MFTVHLQQTDYKLRSCILTTGHMEPWVPLLHRVSVRAMEYQLLSVNGRGTTWELITYLGSVIFTNNQCETKFAPHVYIIKWFFEMFTILGKTKRFLSSTYFFLIGVNLCQKPFCSLLITMNIFFQLLHKW